MVKDKNKIIDAHIDEIKAERELYIKNQVRLDKKKVRKKKIQNRRTK